MDVRRVHPGAAACTGEGGGGYGVIQETGLGESCALGWTLRRWAGSSGGPSWQEGDGNVGVTQASSSSLRPPGGSL